MASFKYHPYAYKKKHGGKYKSIYGDELEKTDKFHRMDSNLFESDVPVETRILIDTYAESDDVSVGHKTVVIDIEVDSTGGYPNVKVPKQKITAIALYDVVGKTYYCYVLDEEGVVVSRTEGDKVIKAFKSEESLLMEFLTKWEEICPTIATGWNCVPKNSRIFTKNKIQPISELKVGDMMCNSTVDAVYPTSNKEKFLIKLSNGHVVESSKDHIFPIISIPSERYTTLKKSVQNRKYMKSLNVEVKNINFDRVTNFIKIPIHTNKNLDMNISDEEIYLAGFIYTDGTLRTPSKIGNGYRIYQSNLELLNSFTQLNTKIGGNKINGFRRGVKSSLLKNMHKFIYNELGRKSLNVELLSELSERQYYIFLSGILDGDGCGSNGLQVCDYTVNGTDNLYTLNTWNGIFSTKQKNNLRFIDYKKELLSFRHPTKWKKYFSKNIGVDRNSKQKAQQINYKKVDGYWYVKIKEIVSSGEIIEMMDIKTSTGYFVMDGVETHNCDGFDFPYLHGRLEYVFDEPTAGRLSPIGIAYYNQYKGKMTIAGVNCIDYLLLYKQYAGKNLPNYRLDTVGQEELKIGKISYQGSLDELKKTDINKFIEYNLHDVILVSKLDDKLQFIALAMTICHVCHTGYEEFNISGKILEGALLTYLRRKHLVAPNKNLESEEEIAFNDDDEDENDDKVGFKGAYVKDPIPGRYDWVCSADINSLYPSTIMSLNISPETKICVIPEWNSEKLVKKSQDKIEFGGDEYTYEEFGKEIVENNLSVSANGVVYDQSKLGCIPDILKTWFSQRLEQKKKMKEASDSGDKAGEVFWKRRQHVQKILLNSLYGVLGLPSFRFYDLDNALAVTATGQEIIKTSAKLVNVWFNKRCSTTEKDYVIYIDTDSLYLDMNALAKHEGVIDIKPFAVSEIETVATNLNDFYKVAMVRMFNSTDNRIKIAADVVAKSAFWLVKKRYAMMKVYDMELQKDIDKMEVKGLDVVRSSFPKKFRGFMETILKNILNNVQKTEMDLFILGFKKQIKDFEIQDVAKNTSVRFVSGENAKNKINFDPKTREPFHFIKGATAQCKSALAYNDMLKQFKLKETEPILSGGKIKWVYLKDNSFGLDGLAFKDDGKDPKMVMDLINTYADRNQIWEKELMKKLTAFYSALGWEIFREEQIDIDTFFSF